MSNDVSLAEYCSGLTFYVAFGEWGGFCFGKDGSAYRLVLGWMCICIVRYDIEKLTSLMPALLEEVKTTVPVKLADE